MTTTFVCKNYAQAKLGRQYDQRTLVPDILEFATRWTKASEKARGTLTVEANVIYGNDSNQLMDIFGVGGANRPLQSTSPEACPFRLRRVPYSIGRPRPR